MYPHLALQLIFTLILLTLPASHTIDNNDQFSTCSNLYSCGENIQGVGYPFWGDDRPQICGLQGFELTCSQVNSFPTIKMNSQTFSVLSIQESSHQMTLAHRDVDGKLCKQGSLYNTDLNDALFAYNDHDDGYLNVYYNCPSDIDTNSSSYSEVKECSENGLKTNSRLSLDFVPGLERCTFNITVPVLNSAILELKDNISKELGGVKNGNIPHLMKLEDVFKQGFSVDYKIDETYCSACENSGGLCWSGTDEVQKTCLCKDGANASVCTTVNKEQFHPAISLLPQEQSHPTISLPQQEQSDSTVCPPPQEQSHPPVSPPPQEQSHSPVSPPQQGQSHPPVSPPPQGQSHPPVSPPPQGVTTKKSQGRGKQSKFGVKIGIGFAAAILGILCTCAIVHFFKAFKNRITKEDKHFEDCITEFGSSIPKRYRYSDVKKMTKSFKDEIGKGGFGSVYKGILPDNRLVAVKLLNSSKGTGEDFINEVASIGRTSHVNVVALLGFCYERKKRALIYEFMPNGSLDKFIYRENQPTTEPTLGWKNLYDITLGIARGLEYLHRGCSTRILHLDIKPNNILLDEEFCPKISDFGLAKVYSGKESIVSMNGGRGTFGYAAPEVGNKNFGGVSHKSDVYSYGVVVLEMVGGRKNLDIKMIDDSPSQIYFLEWIYKRVELDKDLSLHGEMTVEDTEIAKKMLIVAFCCMQENPSERPSINKVIEMLEGNLEALQLPPKP